MWGMLERPQPSRTRSNGPSCTWPGRAARLTLDLSGRTAEGGDQVREAPARGGGDVVLVGNRAPLPGDLRVCLRVDSGGPSDLDAARVGGDDRRDRLAGADRVAAAQS